MKKFLLFIILITIVSCDDSEEEVVRPKLIWKPQPSGIIGNESIQLNWFNSSLLLMIGRPFDYIEPDKFEIFVSYQNINSFIKLTEFDNIGEYTYKVNGLKNNEPIYFYVTSLKSGYNKLISDTIMLIPNKEISPDNLIIKEDNQSVLSVSVANKINKITYVNQKYKWKNEENCCTSLAVFISNFDGSDSELLERNAHSPKWSLDNSKIVFRTDMGEINSGNGTPSQIALYDYETKSITKLTNDSENNYSPVFSDNGEMILYQSSKGNSEKSSTNLWLMNLQSLEKKQLTFIGNADIITYGRVDWINNEDYIFQATLNNSKNHIFKSNINTTKIEKIFDSNWNDYCPSVSPDEKMIAFVSDRSGSNQIWIYNIEKSVFKQITGFSNDEIILEGWLNIDWINNQNITYTINYNKFVKHNIN